jgi:hypothetical protein
MPRYDSRQTRPGLVGDDDVPLLKELFRNENAEPYLAFVQCEGDVLDRDVRVRNDPDRAVMQVPNTCNGRDSRRLPSTRRPFDQLLKVK